MSALAMARELRILVGRLRSRFREQSSTGELTASQLSVILRLERDGPGTVTSLAQAEGVRPQSMGATVSVLESEGFLRGDRDPNDARKTVLSLTEMCKEMIRDERALREDWLFRAIQTQLNLKEQEELGLALPLLKRVAEFRPYPGDQVGDRV